MKFHFLAVRPSVSATSSRLLLRVGTTVLLTACIAWVYASVGVAQEGAPAWAATLAEFNRGAANLDKYEYAEAARAFNKVLETEPSWTAARFNRGLAYLNMAGVNNPAKRLGSTQEMTDTAIATFEEVVAIDQDYYPAWFCLGNLRAFLGKDDQALECFAKVYAHDPDDPFVAYSYAKALRNVNRVGEAVPILEKIVQRDPGFVSGLHLLSTLYMKERRANEAKQLITQFRDLTQEELAVGTFVISNVYGMAGKYSLAVGADGLPLPKPALTPGPRVLFSPELREIAPAAREWSQDANHVRMPALAVADVEGDRDLDLILGGQNEQAAAQVFLNDGTGQFSAGQLISDFVVCLSCGDLDNDGDVDLWLGRAGGDQIWLNDGQGQFALAPSDGVAGSDALTRVNPLADIDSDGDLDLLAFRCAVGEVPAAETGEKPAVSSVYFSNTDGTYVDRASDLGLQCADTQVASVVYGDFDNDLDLDLIVFPRHGAPTAWFNFRGGKSRVESGEAVGLKTHDVLSATTGDPDKDGDQDLLLATPTGLRLYLNDGRFRFGEWDALATGCGRIGGTGAQFVDIDNDGDLDIVMGDARRADGSRGPALLTNTWPQFQFVDASELDHGNLLSELQTGGAASSVAADFTGDGLCDILVADTKSPAQLIVNATQGGHWIAVDLAGKRPQDKTARSNNSAIGARVEVKSGALFQQYAVGGSAGPVASLPLRVHAGLGPHPNVEWLRVMWPDAILQGEVEVPGGRVLAVDETSRKESSCPYLFVWNGTQYEFVADFGGVGGLGYSLGNGQYAAPDPTEYLPLPELVPQDGHYVLQALTPLEEITYFDEAKLLAIDHPIGTRVQPNEMAAVGVAPPEFRMFCVRTPLRPLKATNHEGTDVTEAVQAVDRKYAGATRADGRFLGYAEPHWVEFEFGDQLGHLQPQDTVVLFLQGWVEYAYSSTNYAASQAGCRMQAPSVEVWRDGEWKTLAADVGYPAGVNHMMTIDLAGKLLPSDCRLRLTSNMEVYWDEVFLAVHDGQTDLRIQEIAARSADLHFRGYPREYSPDGQHPNLCDYSNMDRNAAWKQMAGEYTRFGDVLPLLDRADDCFVIMGHGEEITLRFAVDDLGPVPDGCVRSFVLKADSYCKDMDLYTAHPTTVEPLPFHRMSGYPYEPTEHYPDTEATRQYRSQYNTRRINGR
jgi:tetratricopeptide (TPR) repeat protein